MAAPANSTVHGLKSPRTAPITAGSPKMPLPRMLFTVSATKLQRPMARTNFTSECGGFVILLFLKCARRDVENLGVLPMLDKYSDLGPWILGGLATAAVALAMTLNAS